MAGNYDKNQHRRRSGYDVEEDFHVGGNGRRHTNRAEKKSDLLAEDMDDFHPDASQNPVPSLYPQTSFISDISEEDYQESPTIRTPLENENLTGLIFPTTTMRPATTEVSDNINLAQLITPDRALVVAPVTGRHSNAFAMRNECRIAEPAVDISILHDLQRAFPDLSAPNLSKMVRCCQKLPYWIRSLNGQLNARATEFMSEHQLTEEQLYHVNQINKKILFRSSYGVLFVQGNKFFSKANPIYPKRRSAIKGYANLKPTGEYEHPWETAVRMVEREVLYLNRQAREWQWFNMNEHTTEDQRRNYLECLVTGERDVEVLRYIGLFVIRLRSDIQIRTNDVHQTDLNQNWYSIGHEVDNGIFYTIRPFLRYLHEHPHFV